MMDDIPHPYAEWPRPPPKADGMRGSGIGRWQRRGEGDGLGWIGRTYIGPRGRIGWGMFVICNKVPRVEEAV